MSALSEKSFIESWPSGEMSTDGANHQLPSPSSRWDVRQRQLRVGIRGDFSFATFLCMAGKEKLMSIYLLIQQPQINYLSYFYSVYC